MRDENYFLHPVHEWQRRYEALRASFVERLPAKVVAQRFDYSPSYIHLLRHQFIHEKIDFSEPIAEGKAARRRVNSKIRSKICNWREHRLSAGEITQLLSEEGVELSIRTVERVLAEEGFAKLPRRSRLKLGLTVKGAKVPAVSQAIAVAETVQKPFDCESAGVFLFAPFIEKFDISTIVKSAGLPGTQIFQPSATFYHFWPLNSLAPNAMLTWATIALMQV
jgi:transposase